MNPKTIAEFIKENQEPGSLGITENLYGHRVTPGDTPIDRLIAYIDDTYTDFDPKNEKFQKAATKILGKLPTDRNAWVELINSSSQDSKLKDALIQIINNSIPAQISDRAYKAAKDASRYHQGSGIHADECAELAAHYEEEAEKYDVIDIEKAKKYRFIANLWADAAEAEAEHLKDVGGEWDDDLWNKSKSKKATTKAEAATKTLDPTFNFSDWI